MSPNQLLSPNQDILAVQPRGSDINKNISHNNKLSSWYVKVSSWIQATLAPSTQLANSCKSTYCYLHSWSSYMIRHQGLSFTNWLTINGKPSFLHSLLPQDYISSGIKSLTYKCWVSRYQVLLQIPSFNYSMWLENIQTIFFFSKLTAIMCCILATWHSQPSDYSYYKQSLMSSVRNSTCRW